VSQVLLSWQVTAQSAVLATQPKPFWQVCVTQAPVVSQGPTQWVKGVSGQLCKQQKPPEQRLDLQA
jgi:hypothetical protein